MLSRSLLSPTGPNPFLAPLHREPREQEETYFRRAVKLSTERNQCLIYRAAGGSNLGFPAWLPTDSQPERIKHVVIRGTPRCAKAVQTSRKVTVLHNVRGPSRKLSSQTDEPITEAITAPTVVEAEDRRDGPTAKHRGRSRSRSRERLKQEGLEEVPATTLDEKADEDRSAGPRHVTFSASGARSGHCVRARLGRGGQWRSRRLLLQKHGGS